MLKNSYAGFLGLSLAMSAQFTLKMCVASQNHERKFKVVQHHRCWHWRWQP